MTNLLINEPPLQVLPSLARAIGLNEAIILQQIHYWLDPRMNKNKREGSHWVYNSYKQWLTQFPFWSDKTLKRTIYSLERTKLLITKEFNKFKGDKTKWYTINYQELNKYNSYCPPYGQNDHMHKDNLTIPCGQNDPTIYKETETTTEITNSSLNPSSSNEVGKEEEGNKNNNLKNKSATSILKKEFEKDSKAVSMLETWDRVVKEGKGITSLRGPRQIALLNALEIYFMSNLDKWEEFCKKIASSKFLMGEAEGTSFKSIKIDWVLKPETIEKIEEGSYTFGDRNPSKKSKYSNPDKEEIKQIKTLEAKLIEKIGKGKSKEEDYMDILAMRIKEGMEGVADYNLFKVYGWGPKAGFNKVLEDYRQRMVSKAKTPHNNTEALGLFPEKSYVKAEYRNLKKET